MSVISNALTKLLNRLADFTGHSSVFAAMFLLVVGWFVAGIFFRYDSTWFDIMDVFIFLMTFFLVFIIQSSQNADMKALQDKLDEVIDSLGTANKAKEGEEKALKRGRKKGR